MNRSILFLVSLCFIFCASCASPPQPSPRTDYAQDEPEEAQAQAAETTAQHSAPKDDAPATQQGPIDLGLGGDDPNGAAIVINRPDYDDTDLGEEEEDAQTSKTYARKCDQVEQCADLPELSCEGEMACVKKQCVYTCDPDALEDTDEFDDSDEFEDFDEPEQVQ